MLLALALLAGQATGAPPPSVTVTSTAPERVALTVYRAPDRDADDSIDPQTRDQRGYALVTETRTVTIPAGPATLRFEGVAGNIFAETAIVTGLPEGVVERNLDADLLSPRTLYDRALGRRVMVRRTDRATGRVREEQATIRSAANGAGVLQFADGVEALRCSGLPETLVYSTPPEGLVARPTLSIRTESPRAATAKITLSYLAGGFDWQADYVVTMRPDAKGSRRADLFAWVTLASSDVTGFADAATSVIAGKPKREARNVPALGWEEGALRLRCWPTDIKYGRSPPPPPPPPPQPMMASAPAMEASDITVTGMMRRVAKQEDLGDLKLYRLPDAVTVAARSQKQVAMLVRDGVQLDPVYVGAVAGDNADSPRLTLRTRNMAARGLGLPLPAGRVAVFESDARALLLGEGSVEDRAIGEDVEIALGASAAVQAQVERVENAGGRARYRLTVTNANPRPIAYEARIAVGDDERITAKARLGRLGAVRTWSVTIPANGRATLGYTIRDLD